MPQIKLLKCFREALYKLFPKRKDAIMNLLDAIASYGHQSKSVVQLSKSPLFERKYSSITDATSDGLPHANWCEIEKLVYFMTRRGEERNVFLLDCTPNARPFARKLEDRSIIHAPNPAPGNKPICVGHQYSVLAMLPNNELSRKKHWVVPMSAKRVKSDEKGNEVGMLQAKECINNFDLCDKLSITVGDSLYGTENCRKTACEIDRHIHLFRLNSKRNLYFQPKQTTERRKGRKKQYGEKMTLNDTSNHRESDIQTETKWTSRKNKEYTVKICCWKNVLIRGSRQFSSSQHPINLIKICLEDKEGNSLYKRPLWLAVFGKLRDEISLIECYEYYSSRYDIEHFFRFGKQKLLLDAYQTSDVEHEEFWWRFCMLAYVQLYFGKTLATLLPEEWERYLPEYKSSTKVDGKITSPSQTQRGFDKVLEQIGTPAAPCVARGNPRGRMVGEIIQKRDSHKIIFKAKKDSQKQAKAIISESEQPAKISNHLKIADFVKSISLSKISFNISVTEITKSFENTA